jgi:hypothetical protein
MTSRRWIKPPRVYEDTRPRSHNTSKITKMVHSMGVSFCRRLQMSTICRLATGYGSNPASASVFTARYTCSLTHLL